jgi:RND family efflux transporter MFP subunit
LLKLMAKIVVPLVVLASAVTVAGYLRASRPTVTPVPPQERVWLVAAVVAKAVEVRPRIPAFGEITAARIVDLRPLVAGRVVAVGPNFIDGGIVAEGELLIAVDDFEYQAKLDETLAEIDRARARLAEIEAGLGAERAMLDRDRERVTLSRRDVERREKLRGTGASSQKALDDARLTLNSDQQRVIGTTREIDKLAAQARQQEAEIQRLEVTLRRARRNLEETRLTAPFDGFLVEVDAHIGRRVGVGDRVARLYDATRLEARFHLSHAKFARLRGGGDFIGRPVRIVWRVGDEALAYDGVIDRVDGRIDPASGGVDLFARIKGSGRDLPLRPGAFVEVEVADVAYENVIRLPESALYGGDTVYVVEDGRLAPRRVEVAVRDGTAVFVRGEIAGGSQVVTTRFAEIGPGVMVEIR